MPKCTDETVVFGRVGRRVVLTWDKERRVIARLEHGPRGGNPRYIVTNLLDSAKALYERRYCARGEAENRIKEAQAGARVAIASRPISFACCWPGWPKP